jgi:tetratricopeptide (TPR) repeat protein
VNAGLASAFALGAWCLARAASAQPDLDEAAEALSAGRYEAGEAALLALGAGTGALCPGALCPAEERLGRLRLEQSRTGEALAIAEAVLRREGLDAASELGARTLLGEAHAARGELDAAEVAFGAAAASPGARRAQVLLARLLSRRGHDDEAAPLLRGLVRAYNEGAIGPSDAEGLAYVAMAAAMLGSPHDASDAFAESTRADRRRVETQLEWARLFLDHHDPEHAAECVEDALRANPRHPLALTLAARVALARSMDFAAAAGLLARAHVEAPELVPAHVTRAAMALRDQDLEAADMHLTRALDADPTDHEALSVRAAVRFVAGDLRGMERAIDAVHAIHPRDVRVFSVLAEHADWEHRYAEQVELARRALVIAPDDAAALATLGMNLLRLGDEDGGLAALEGAWRHDRFDARVFRTLEFYESVIPSYVWLEDAPPSVRIRAHREEARLLGVVVPPLVREALGSLRRRYGVRPRRVDVELYASARHFALRTAGLPNLGVQGVCFGRVVTALSPRAGSFDTAQVLWHELSHVAHLALSRNRVPRWLTEGLAEYETTIARSEWAREEDHRLHLMLRSGRLPPLRDMNRAFTHAESPTEVLDAYYASTRIAGFLVDTFGMRRIVALLREYGRGRSSDEAFSRALGASIDDVERRFRERETARLAERASDFSVDLLAYRDLDARRALAESAPGDALARAGFAAALLARRELAAALSEASAALELDPDEPTARFVALEVALAGDDGAAARAHAARLLAAGHDGVSVRLGEARAALLDGDPTAARAALRHATELDPPRIEPWAALATLASASGDEALRRVALARVVALDQHDRGALSDLVGLYAAAADAPAIVALAERARFLDPGNAPLQARVGRAFLDVGDPEGALGPLELALAAQEPEARALLAHAEACARLGRRAEAEASADAARELDPSLAAELDRILPAR